MGTESSGKGDESLRLLNNTPFGQDFLCNDFLTSMK